ncbi:hypothetical protein [Nonomuraea jiangxiensis]|uniref:Uncharacterized protein n=1 Tax=Nonomuraea jiangxiensis TaxID=633440 RepID=A0A1G8DNS7_9ACTN|nr:hypothetical protein [Nonomuraea jiangxiensis]SDH59080.1 hypothetical protein SAMN05421869_102619 [Nonomuraea jiangxiensis]
MSNKCRIAFAVLAGYYLGRRRKLRMAAALAAAGLAGRARMGEGGVLAQGLKALGSAPEIEQLTGRLRGELLEVGKAAAVAATSRQIDSLSDRLHERAEAMRAPGAPKERRRPDRAQDEQDEYDEGEYDERHRDVRREEDEQEDSWESGRARQRPRPVRRTDPSRRQSND